MFRKLLVPLDRSRFAEQAVVEAGEIARRSNAAVRLVLVHQPIAYAGFEDVPWLADQAESDRGYLNTMAARLQVGNVPVTTTVLKGDPAEMICREAIDSGCDLIVMSTHGRTGFDRMWMGSVAHSVVRHAGLPALLIRPAPEESHVTTEPAEIRRILVTLDDSSLAREILTPATELALCHGASVMVLRVVPPVSWIPPMTNMPYAASSPVYDEDLTRNLVASAEKDMDRVRGQLEKVISGVASSVIVDVSVAHAILKFADDHHADLIAMSTHGRGASRLFLGSVADKVLRGAHAPMLLRSPSSTRTNGLAAEADDAATGKTHGLQGGSMRTDKELQRDVIDELNWTPALRDEEIGVAVKDGVVTLSGDVSNYVKKYDAERAAEKIHGVKAVAVDINVKLPLSSFRSDTDIAHEAVNALKWDVQVPDDKIRLRVEDGRIIMDGEVEWQYQRSAAERAVRYLSGVNSVSNFISVKPKKISTYDVSQKIKAAFKRSAEIDSSRITVESADGKVTLKGNVRSWAERRDAESAAWSAPGVTQVDDRLGVTL